MVAPSLVKPTPWAWNRAALAPEWRSIARGLRLFVPGWTYRPGAPTDLGLTWGDAWLDGKPEQVTYDQRYGIEGEDEFYVGPYGPAYNRTTSADLGRLYYVSATPRTNFTTEGEVTVIALVYNGHTAANVKDIAGIWYNSETANQQYLLSYYQDKVSFFIRQANGTQKFAQADSTSLSRWVVAGGSASLVTGNVEAYVDGEGPQGSEPYDGTLQNNLTGGEQPFCWMGRWSSPDVDEHWRGKIALVYLWARALSPAEHRRVAEDPFGLLRRSDHRQDVGWYESGGPYVWG